MSTCCCTFNWSSPTASTHLPDRQRMQRVRQVLAHLSLFDRCSHKRRMANVTGSGSRNGDMKCAKRSNNKKKLWRMRQLSQKRLPTHCSLALPLSLFGSCMGTTTTTVIRAGDKKKNWVSAACTKAAATTCMAKKKKRDEQLTHTPRHTYAPFLQWKNGHKIEINPAQLKRARVCRLILFVLNSSVPTFMIH